MIEFREAEERAVSQRSRTHCSTWRTADSTFSSWNDDGSVMFCQLPIGRVEVGLIATGSGDGRL
jgi:hypothetical protein